VAHGRSAAGSSRPVRLVRRHAGDLAPSPRLEPADLRWRFRRQKIVLSDPALTGQLASTPEFWQAVQALGDRYYPPTEMAGMPEPLPPR